MNYLAAGVLSAGLIMSSWALQADERQSQLDAIVVTADPCG